MYMYINIEKASVNLSRHTTILYNYKTIFLFKKIFCLDVDSVLKSRQQRQIWEKEFDRVFIKPVTTVRIH